MWKLLACMVLLAWVPGCSVDGGEGVVVYESGTLYAVQVEAAGLHLSTVRVDRGVTLGRYRAVYIVPKENHAGFKVSREGHAGGLQQRLGAEGAFRRASFNTSEGGAGIGIDLGRAIGVVGWRSGLMVGFGRLQWGVTLGVRESSLVCIPYDFEGEVFLDVVGDQPGMWSGFYRRDE